MPYRVCPNGCIRNWYVDFPYNYCYECGTEMIEEKRSEEQ